MILRVKMLLFEPKNHMSVRVRSGKIEDSKGTYRCVMVAVNVLRPIWMLMMDGRAFEGK